MLKVIMTFLFFFTSNQTWAVKRVPYKDGLIFIEWGQFHSIKDRQKMLGKIMKTGSRHITLVVFGCQSSLFSADVGSCEVHSPDYVFETLSIARQMGFDVTLLPILTTPQWEWRGHFNPLDVSAWFKSYTNWITNLAKRCERNGVIELVIASEISRLYQYTNHWVELAKKLRLHFSGNLIITSNWDHYDFAFWPAVDAIGVSAYFPIASNLTPTLEELRINWSKHKKNLLAIANKYNRPIHFTEIGYESVTGAARTPWAAPREGPVDFAHQAACFTAFTETWKEERSLLRASIWASDDNYEYYNRSFEIMGKPAQQVLQNFFVSRNALKDSNNTNSNFKY